jgi:H+/gluconate symporter-like permease
MTIERYLRAIAGFFVFVSVLLAHFHSPYWLLFTGFVGLNLLQSAFTDWCPMMTILKKLGVGTSCQRAKNESEV